LFRFRAGGGFMKNGPNERNASRWGAKKSSIKKGDRAEA